MRAFVDAVGMAFAVGGLCLTACGSGPSGADVSATPAPAPVTATTPAPGRTMQAITDAPVAASGPHALTIFYGTDRNRTDSDKPGSFYGNERNSVYGSTEFGVCEISFPESHERVRMDSPFWRPLGDETRVRKTALSAVTPADPEDFFADLQARMDDAPTNDAFVFVHGFNLDFEDAALRAARLASDLGFTGAPILYSWPSRNSVSGYPTDEATVQWCAPHLAAFLRDVAERSGAERIHIIAHSLGARAVTHALMRLNREGAQMPLFDQLILAAPDIDAAVFESQLAPRIMGSARGITLYVSSNDKALLASRKLHRYPRAGEPGEQLVVMSGIDTVDVSAIDSGLGMNHDYYAQNRSVVNDMYHLLRNRLSPRDRNLIPREKGGVVYWEFVP